MNFGGYEIVREISRSPLGLSATARGPDGGPEAYFVQVQYFDPIASRGEERFVVEAFLERARIQGLAQGKHWAQIHAVGEIDEGAFAVSELFPRTAQALIDGRTRLASADLQRVMLGAIDALAELRACAQGRPHGALRAESVLVDDSGGPGRWRVALADPSAEAWNAEQLARAKLRDARALGAVAIGLVEHRQPRALPTRLEVSEPWKRVGGSQAEAWVAAVNRLLDADLDPNSRWLETARENFASIKVGGQKRSRAPFVAAGVVVLALAGGGAWFALRDRGGGEVDPIIVTELTQPVWQDWLSACVWVPALRADLEAFLKDEVATLSPEAGAFVAEIIRVSPTDAAVLDQDKKDDLEYEWRPGLLFPDKKPQAALFITDAEGNEVASEEMRLALLALGLDPNPATHANAVAVRVSQIRERCAAPPAIDDLTALTASLREWGGAEAQLQGLEAAARVPAPEEIDSVEEVMALVRAVDAGTRAATVRADLADLDRRVAALEERLGAAAEDDPVLSRLGELVRGGVVAVLGEGGDARQACESLASAVRDGGSELDAVSRFLDDGYARVEQVELRKLLLASGEPKATGFAAIAEWRRMAKDERVTILERDPLAGLRSAGEVEQFLKDAEDRIRQVDGLPQKADNEEIRDAVPRMQAEIAAVRAKIDEALALPRTQAYEADLAQRRADFTAQLREVESDARDIFVAFSKTLDDLIGELNVSQFPDDPELGAVLDGTKERLRGLAEEARGGSEDEENRRAGELLEEYQTEVDRLEAIRAHTARALRPVASPGINSAPLFTLFEERRRQLQRTLAVRQGGETPPGASEELESLAGEIEAAVAAAADLEDRLDRWALPPTDTASLLAPAFSQGPGITAAFAQAVGPLAARVGAVTRLAGTPAELLATARDPAANEDLRRAAFESAGRADPAWPASGADLRTLLDSRTALVTAIEGTSNPLWSVAEVDALAAAAWERAMANAADEEAFIEVRAMRDRFGLDASAEAELPEAVRRNAALVDLRTDLDGITPTEDPAADDQAVRDVVTTWLVDHTPLFDADTDWLADLRGALESQSTTGRDFSAGDHGPGAAGWSGAADSDIEVLTYRRGGSGPEMRFRRVETGDGERAWFLAVEEVSLELFLDVTGASLTIDDHDNVIDGPRGWKVAGEALSSESWFEHRGGVGDLTLDPLFEPDVLLAPGTEAMLRTELDHALDGDKQVLPVQNISLDHAEDFCEAIGCELPPVEVWRAAAEATYASAGAGGVGVHGQAASVLGLQVRDATWGVQAAYDAILPQNDAARRPAHSWWFEGALQWVPVANRGAFEAGLAEIWPGVDDGMMYFAPVAGRTGVLWPHIVGNVFEIIQDATGFAAIGGSAMSPPSVNPSDAVPLRAVDLPAADVGFRPAFWVSAEALNPTVARKVGRVLNEAPVQYPAVGPP